ncbi:MAG: ferredoxin [Cyanobacteria bacterium P01_G01_bin.54]
MSSFDSDFLTTPNPESFDLEPSVPESNTAEPTGYEPELGGIFRDAPDRTGFEPELGGMLRQKGVYVDEITCIGCKHCAHTAPNTFYMEPEHGRARVLRQDGDPEAMVDEAIDTCPVNCIHWVDYTELKHLEAERQHQVIPIAGFPLSATAHKKRSAGNNKDQPKPR